MGRRDSTTESSVGVAALQVADPVFSIAADALDGEKERNSIATTMSTTSRDNPRKPMLLVDGFCGKPFTS
jgi:hypothetical protein